MKKGKCTYCKKKLSLTESLTNKCRCNKKFCSKCIYNHNCDFDYKRLNKDIMEKKYNKIEFQKLEKV